jgi:competence protein ComEA
MSRKTLAVIAAGATVGLIVGFIVVTLVDANRGAKIVIEGAPSDVEIAIWVDGAVATPGVYRLSGDGRMNDAIEAAGGVTGDADLSGINLASRLSDAQHVVIPSLSVSAVAADGATPTANAAGPAAAVPASKLIDINTASETELDTLPGIGPVIASRIVAYRDANGRFARVEELARVEGISSAMVDKLRDLITVGS